MDLFLPLRWLTATLLSTVVAITLAQIAMRYLFQCAPYLERGTRALHDRLDDISWLCRRLL